MSRLRIAMISEHASPLAQPGSVDSGGQNVYVDKLSRELARLGMSVDIFTRRDAASLPARVELCPGVRVIHVPAGPARKVPKEDLWQWMPAFGDWMLRRFSSQAYDLIHANFWMSADVARRLSLTWDTPFVVTFHALGLVRKLHQGEADRFPAERAEIERAAMAAAAGIIAECPQDLEDMVSLYGAPEDRISVVPCGVEPAELSPVPREEARAEIGVRPEDLVVLQLGRMVPRKGIDNVIEALGELRRSSALAPRLLVVGDEAEGGGASPERDRLRAVAQASGVDGLVRFEGRQERSRLRYWYSAADVFVTTPWYEPFGITPLEAMACGVPVVGSCVGGIKSTVVDGETGYLVPPKDPQALAGKLEALLRDPARAKAMGARGRMRVLEQYTWPLVARAVAGVYERALGESGAGEDERTEAFAVLEQGFRGAIEAIDAARIATARPAFEAAEVIAEAFRRGNKVLVCGNGGSAADSQHFAGELVGRYRKEDRRGLPVIALTADSAILTAWANDVGYADVFARQVQALGQPGDVLLGISTSGRSPNVLHAMDMAAELGLRRVALTGRDGGPLARAAEVCITVPHSDTQHIQEAHSVLVHLLCDLIELRLGKTVQAWQTAETRELRAIGGGQ
jgi:phosphoheptose isomerase